MGFLRCCVYYGILASCRFHRAAAAKILVPRRQIPLPLRELGSKALPFSARARVAGQGARHEQDRPQAHSPPKSWARTFARSFRA